MRRHFRLLAAAGLFVSSCSGSISLQDLGHSCSDPGDRAGPPYYFDRVSLVVEVGSSELAEITGVGPVSDTHTDVAELLQWSESVFDDGSVVSPSEVWMGPAIRDEVVRLPDGETALVAIAPSSDGSWVQFVTVVMENGELAFAGECADRFYRTPLGEYRDALRPGRTLESVFIEVIADDETWSEFAEFVG